MVLTWLVRMAELTSDAVLRRCDGLTRCAMASGGGAPEGRVPPASRKTKIAMRVKKQDCVSRMDPDEKVNGNAVQV